MKHMLGKCLLTLLFGTALSIGMLCAGQEEGNPNQEDAANEYRKGLSYELGNGGEKNASEALRCYRRAAELGHPGAQFRLGLAYQSGKELTQDMEEALRWFRLAAEQGHTGARSFLASAQLLGATVDGQAVAILGPAVRVGPHIRNGGFETTGRGGADLFLDWIEGATGGSAWARDTTIVWSGAASARLDIDGKNNHARLFQSGILVAGARYRLTMMIRHNKPVAITSLQYHDGGPAADTVFAVRPIDPNTWTAVELEFTARGAGFAICRPSAAGLAGFSLWIDHVVLMTAGSP